jgi:hypothetical protein
MTSPASQNPMRYIQRIDNAHHTWKVALRRKNKMMHKYFTDEVYGGTAQALIAAIAWRDETEAKHATASYAIWRRERMPPTNTTGIVGVYRGMNEKKRAGRISKFYYWQGHWTGVDGKRNCRTFSINKYGEEAAKELAIRARREGLAQLAREIRRAGLKPKKAT